jgi:heparanase
VMMHNTLAASDYGLLDEKTFAPRPNYWAALLWRKFMGTTVLDPAVPKAENVYAFAHCLQDHSGGVALLVINADRERSYQITMPTEAERYTLTAAKFEDKVVNLNGSPLKLGSNDDLPQLKDERTRSGRLSLAPTSITFLSFPSAGNNACR